MDIDANLQKGEALFTNGLLDEAENVFKEIIRINPDHYEALINKNLLNNM